VEASSSPSSQAPTRTTFIAAAIPRWCKCIFAKPIYRERRMPKARTRFPKWWLQCLLAEHILWQRLVSFVDGERLEALHAGQTARMVMVRRLYFFSERIQWTWRGQRPQSLVENLILITSLVRLSMAGVQLILRCPSGQIACWHSQSMRNWLASMPCSDARLPLHITTRRTNDFNAVLRLDC
jgi:hypothetical protein